MSTHAECEGRRCPECWGDGYDAGYKHALDEMVPRSRYDACNSDWLAAKAELKNVREAARKLVSAMQVKLDKAERSLRCYERAYGPPDAQR